MVFVVPDGMLDRTHAWQQEQDMSLLLNSDVSGPEEQKMNFALLCAQPSTPEDFITSNLTNPFMPPPMGYDREQPTLQDVFTVSSPRAAGQADQVQGGMH